MYCKQCGKEVSETAKFCGNCGKPTAQKPVASQQDLIDKLSTRLRNNGFIWITIAIIQFVMGWYGDLSLLIVGALNIISAVFDIWYSQRILSNQDGIVAAGEPIVRSIITLAYNLFIGGVIGVLGSIYYLIFIRGFIMKNKSRFLAMETANPIQNNIIRISITLTEQEARNGVEKEIYVAELQRTLNVCVPKNTKDGQTLAAHNVKGTNQDGTTIEKDVYIKISIKH